MERTQDSLGRFTNGAYTHWDYDTAWFGENYTKTFCTNLNSDGALYLTKREQESYNTGQIMNAYVLHIVGSDHAIGSGSRIKYYGEEVTTSSYENETLYEPTFFVGLYNADLSLSNFSSNIPMFREEDSTSINKYIANGDTSGAINRDDIYKIAIKTTVYRDDSKPPNIKITWDITEDADKAPDNIHVKIINTPVYGDVTGKDFINVLLPFTDGYSSYTWGALETLAGSELKAIAIQTNATDDVQNICTAYIGISDGQYSPQERVNSEDLANSIQAVSGTGSEDDGYSKEHEKSDATDEQTTVNTANLLTTTYKLTETQLQALGNFIWTDNFMTNIKLLNNSPIENIISVKAIPSIFDGTEEKHVVCGNVDTNVTGIVITNNYKKKTIGSITVPRWYNNFVDYEHSQIMLYLPLIGQITDLDPHEVMGYKITLKYCFDVITGDVLAEVFNNRGGGENIIGVYRGNCGIDIPLTSTNRAQVEAGYISDAISGITSIVAKDPMGAVNSGMSALTRQNTTRSSGSVSGVTVQGLPNKAYLTVITQVLQNYGKKFAHTFGKVCCQGFSKLKSLSGFTVVDSNIDLSSIPCTQTEREELRTILASGFYM